MTAASANNSLEHVCMERKIIPVSSKGQITIPKKFIKELHLGKEVEIIVDNGIMIVKPAMKASTNEFSEYILRDLVAQGLQGDELINEFINQNSDIKNAAQSMLAEAHILAVSTNVPGSEKLLK